MYRTGGRDLGPRPVVGKAGEAGLDGVLEDVLEGVDVVLLGLDQLRVVAAAEDVVAEPPALVEATRVTSVEVAHTFGEVRLRCLEDEVVMRAQKAGRMDSPGVAARDATKEMQKEPAVVVFEEDESAAVSYPCDVVVRTGGEVAAGSAHPFDGSAAPCQKRSLRGFWHTTGSSTSRARHWPWLVRVWSIAPCPDWPRLAPGTSAARNGRGLTGHGLCLAQGVAETDASGPRAAAEAYAATLLRSRCWCDGQ